MQHGCSKLTLTLHAPIYNKIELAKREQTIALIGTLVSNPLKKVAQSDSQYTVPSLGTQERTLNEVRFEELERSES